MRADKWLSSTIFLLVVAEREAQTAGLNTVCALSRSTSLILNNKHLSCWHPRNWSSSLLCVFWSWFVFWERGGVRFVPNIRRITAANQRVLSDQGKDMKEESYFD